MNELLYENTKVASYFLWEYTQHEKALDLWLCAEDMAYFLDTISYYNSDKLVDVKQNGMYDIGYIEFVRNIAFRIYIYTNNEDHISNWYIAEKLLGNLEWCQAVTKVAEIFNQNKSNFEFLTGVRSDQVKQYYKFT